MLWFLNKIKLIYAIKISLLTFNLNPTKVYKFMDKISFIFLKEIIYTYIILYLFSAREKKRIGFFKNTYKNKYFLNISFI